MVRSIGGALLALASLSCVVACSSDASMPPAAAEPGRCVPGECGGCEGCLAACLCATDDVATCVATCQGGAAGNAGWPGGAAGSGATPGGSGAAGSGGGAGSGAGSGGAGGVAGAAGAAGVGGATGGVGGSAGGSLPSDDCYSEAVFPDADLDDILASYGGGDWKDELIEAVGRRWPAGGWFLERQRHDSYFDQFSDPSSWSGMVGTLDTLVHEETHLFNAYHAQAMGRSHSLFIRDDLILYLPEEGGFPRSEIYELLAPGTVGQYAKTYLTGTSGQRGLNPLLDELTCYSNELPAVALLGEYFPGYGVSLRDGTVAFLYYLQVYLRRARTAHPSFYEQARAEPAYRDAVKVSWLRAHYFLEHADRFPRLGIDDGKYRAVLYEPENLDEISRFIGQTVGESSCVM